MDIRDVWLHRVNQLEARIKERGLAYGELVNEKGKMCIVGHMMDMAGVLDESFNHPAESHPRLPLKEFGGCVDSDRITLPVMAIIDHFGLPLQYLEQLQAANDHGSNPKEAVLRLLSQYDPYQ